MDASGQLQVVACRSESVEKVCGPGQQCKAPYTFWACPYTFFRKQNSENSTKLSVKRECQKCSQHNPAQESRTIANDKELGRFVTENELSSKFITKLFVLFQTTFHEDRVTKNKEKSTNDRGWYTCMEKDWPLWLERKRSEYPNIPLKNFSGLRHLWDAKCSDCFGYGIKRENSSSLPISQPYLPESAI
jgi:hypothetical protein